MTIYFMVPDASIEADSLVEPSSDDELTPAQAWQKHREDLEWDIACT